MKIVYLDQKDWIFLAKGYYDKSLKPNTEVCSLVLKASEEGVIFPLSIIHFQETLQHLNKERRERLASFMVRVSKGYSISPCTVIMKMEIRQAIFRKVGLPVVDLRNTAIRHGISGMLGAKGELITKPDFPPELKKELLDYMDSPSALLKLMTIPEISDYVRQIKEGDSEIIKKMEENRQQNAKIKDKNLRYAACIASFWLETIIPEMAKICYSLNLPPSILPKGSTQKEITELFQSMPTAYCLFTLSQDRDQNMRRPIKETDLYDIWALSVAIPYCEIVLADSMFYSISRQAKLDEIYNTVILDSSEELKKYL
jgi:hypothetical protein